MNRRKIASLLSKIPFKTQESFELKVTEMCLKILSDMPKKSDDQADSLLEGFSEVRITHRKLSTNLRINVGLGPVEAKRQVPFLGGKNKAKSMNVEFPQMSLEEKS